MNDEISTGCGEGKAVIEFKSAYGYRTRFTITAEDTGAIRVHGVYIKKDGTITEDAISVTPVDKNAVIVFV